MTKDEVKIMVEIIELIYRLEKSNVKNSSTSRKI